MVEITQALLVERARSLMVAMTERERWVYALSRDGSLGRVTAVLAEQPVERVAEDADGTVVKYSSADGDAELVVFDSQELEVVLLQGRGGAIVPALVAIVEATGFCPQSGLWGDALRIGESGAQRALRIVAHMAVVWDDDWTDLFLLHLASPDPIVRHDAVVTLVIAALVAGDVEPAVELLSEARRRERMPKLAETMAEATSLLRDQRGDPIDVATVGRSAKW